MLIDWQASKEEWISSVRAQLIPLLLNDKRFISSKDLVSRFERSVTRWGSGSEIRQVINDGNELAAAVALLKIMEPTASLHYEPRLSSTRKRLDFLIKAQDGSCSWIDMKTVAPSWNNDEAAWMRLVEIATDFPSNAQLIVNQDFCGAALGGQLLNARCSFVQRTIEVEAKVAFLTAQERGPVRLLFCSSGEWHEDDLEDFADFYMTGAFRADDWAQNAVARYMEERGLSFRRTLSGFCYLERRHDEAEARCFRFGVRGPVMFAPIRKSGDSLRV